MGKGFKRGEKNCNWKGGIAEYPNHGELKRRRLEALKKTGGKCEICNKAASGIHHIDESKDNHKLNNLFVVCRKCHGMIHAKELGERGKETSKYIRLYGMTLKEAGIIFNACPSTILNWIKNPEKQIWFEKKLKAKTEAKEVNREVI